MNKLIVLLLGFWTLFAGCSSVVLTEEEKAVCKERCIQFSGEEYHSCLDECR